VVFNQYVVDSAEQTSAFEAYSLSCRGADLEGHDTPDEPLAQVDRHVLSWRTIGLIIRRS
jgi:hypothetical protein